MDKDILDKESDLMSKAESAVGLHKKLHRSLQIQSMCDDAFSHGSCSAKFISRTDGDVVLRITRGDGSTKFIPWDDVPDFFKEEEADRRTLLRRVLQASERPGLNGPVGKKVREYIMEQKKRERVMEHKNKEDE